MFGRGEALSIKMVIEFVDALAQIDKFLQNAKLDQETMAAALHTKSAVADIITSAADFAVSVWITTMAAHVVSADRLPDIKASSATDSSSIHPSPFSRSCQTCMPSQGGG